MQLIQVQLKVKAGQDTSGPARDGEEVPNVFGGEFAGGSKCDGGEVHVDGDRDGELGGHRMQVLYEALEAGYMTSTKLPLIL